MKLLVLLISNKSDVTGVFLNISKASGKVWYEDHIYKMKCIRIRGMPLKTIQNFLKKKFQRVVFNCHTYIHIAGNLH